MFIQSDIDMYIRNGLFFTGLCQFSQIIRTRHNSADSVPTNLICIKEVAIRTTFSHMIYIAGKNYYTCSLGIDIECTCYKKCLQQTFLTNCVSK